MPDYEINILIFNVNYTKLNWNSKLDRYKLVKLPGLESS